MNEKEKKSLILAVHEVVQIVPCGRVTSYGAIAKAIGYPNLSRMVGRIISQSTLKNAYRVVNSKGELSGKDAFGNSNEMKKLLEAEGIIIINDRVKDLKNIFWDPLNEIRI